MRVTGLLFHKFLTEQVKTLEAFLGLRNSTSGLILKAQFFIVFLHP